MNSESGAASASRPADCRSRSMPRRTKRRAEWGGKDPAFSSWNSNLLHQSLCESLVYFNGGGRSLWSDTTRPDAVIESTMPSDRGASGPTMTRLMPSLSHQRSIGKLLYLFHSCGHGSAQAAIPPLLVSVAKSASQRGDWRSFQARACSRPPPPMSRIRQVSGHDVGEVVIEGGKIPRLRFRFSCHDVLGS